MTSSLPLLVIIGPSGSGKSSATRLLVNRGLVRVHPTWTTRPRRSDEHFGSPEHRFVDDVTLFGLPYRYGLPPIRRSNDLRADVVMLRAPLVERFRRVVTDPSAVV